MLPDSLPLATRLRERETLRHLVLFALTWLTMSFAGGLFWEGGLARVERLSDLLNLAVVVRNLRAGALYATVLSLILLAHEMGHYLACRYHGIRATLPFFIPGPPLVGTFGAVIRIRSPIPHRRALFDVAAAGPIAGFLIALPALALGLYQARPLEGLGDTADGLFLGEPLISRLLQALVRPGVLDIEVNSLFGAGWVGLLVTSLNLFPVGQLDGGHAAYAISPPLHRVVSWITLGGLGFLVFFEAVRSGGAPPYLVWFGILLWMRDRHPRLLDETGTLGAGRLALAVLLLAIFVLSLMLSPIELR